MKLRSMILPAVILCCGASNHALAYGELVVSAFTGFTSTANDDLTLKQPGEDVTLHNAEFHGRDFGSPPYYGGRITYFLHKQTSGFGFGLEFFHPKIYLDTGENVNVTGTVGGAPVSGSQPVSDYFNHFNNSHGLNFLTAEGLYRWYLAKPEESFWGRFQPYAGAGVAAVIPHVESYPIGGSDYESYELRGPGLQGMAGLNFDICKHFSIFGEYRITYVPDLNESIPGGSIEIDPLTHAFVTGLSIKF